MKLTSILAIYALFWTLSLFVILPIGVKTSEEMGEERGKGHADSAPHRHDLKRKVVWTTLLASALFAVRSEEHTSELQSLMRISYAVFCLKKKKEANVIQDQHTSNYRAERST